jgi:hypothetical protein
MYAGKFIGGSDMTERYLFRAKSCVGNWRYGFLKKQLVNGESDVWAIQSENSLYPCKYTAVPLYENVVDPATIGQCTGLCAAKSYRGDKPEHLLVFEGDLLRWHSGDPELNDDMAYPVVWYQAGWHIDQGTDTVEMGVETLDGNRMIEWEIVGNRWDTPELLEV